MIRSLLVACLTLLTSSLAEAQVFDEPPGRPKDAFDIPVLDGEAWSLTGNPELGKYTSENQEPVDFGVWQAADGAWQLWSCIRHTKCGGETRLFHCWEGDAIDHPDWKPMGIAMQADESLGETKGGLQAPHVVLHDGKYHMLYGDWINICLATSDDGKNFTRVVQPNGKTGMFSDGPAYDGNMARDPMAFRVGDQWHVYYTVHPNQQCVIRCRTSPDLKHWSRYSTTVAFGGRAGAGPYTAECPHVVEHKGLYYLFRTEKYGAESKTHVYVSSDPLHFGVNRDEWYYATTLPIAAPEYVKHDGQEFLVSLKRDLNGVRAHRLKWAPSDSAQAVSQAN